MANKLVTCPYEEVHKVKESRMAAHITKCRQNHLDDPVFTCSFNACHIYPIQEKSYHLLHCPDKAMLDRALYHGALEKNNPFKGNTSVPSYTASAPTVTDEVWDDDIHIQYTKPAAGFVPKTEAPNNFMSAPPAISKPSERRKMYQELHGKSTELENRTDKPVNRQPKAPSQVENKNSQDFLNLGLGRGRPATAAAVAPSRIAANIFAPSPAPRTVSSNSNYSAALTTGMSNLGLGRGFCPSSGGNDLLDDDFPALGCGRGVYRRPKTDVRYPGSRN